MREGLAKDIPLLGMNQLFELRPHQVANHGRPRFEASIGRDSVLALQKPEILAVSQCRGTVGDEDVMNKKNKGPPDVPSGGPVVLKPAVYCASVPPCGIVDVTSGAWR